MREVLSEMIDMLTSVAKIDAVKVIGSETQTVFRAINDSKTVIMRATMNEPLVEFEGTSGISNLKLLSGLLDFASYRAEGATFTVERRTSPMTGNEAPAILKFSGKDGAKAEFRLMSEQTAPEQPDIRAIPWEISFVPDPVKVKEFSALARLYHEVDAHFTPSTDENGLHFHVGREDASTHSASMLFSPEIEGTLKGVAMFEIDAFQALTRLATGKNSVVSITSMGVIGTTITAQHGVYEYFMRAKR
jgi:hypothetical protein